MVRRRHGGERRGSERHGCLKAPPEGHGSSSGRSAFMERLVIESCLSDHYNVVSISPVLSSILFSKNSVLFYVL